MCCKMVKRVLLLLLIPFNMYSQQYKINLEQIHTEDKVLYGTIDDKYEITIYLKYSASSEDHMAIYSVKGWYQYNNIKKHIPLVGIYDFSDGLTLYSLKDKSLEAKIADFDIPGDYVWKKIEYVKSISDFDEKFTISDNPANNKWTNNKKEFKLQIANLQDNSITNDFIFLKLDKDTTINLADFQLGYTGMEIINYTTTKTEKKILLKYQEYGNPNIQGRCGAATDFGFIILSFDSDNNLNYKEIEEVENCRGDIYSEDIPSADKSLLQFKIIDSSEEKEVERKFTVNTKSIFFIKEKQQ